MDQSRRPAVTGVTAPSLSVRLLSHHHQVALSQPWLIQSDCDGPPPSAPAASLCRSKPDLRSKRKGSFSVWNRAKVKKIMLFFPEIDWSFLCSQQPSFIVCKKSLKDGFNEKKFTNNFLELILSDWLNLKVWNNLNFKFRQFGLYTSCISATPV